jgi:response regulator RpfG family c-di-GMP phosphodiesterase
MIKRRKIIFIVDDNNANLVSCKNILKPFYEVYPAPSAAKMFVLLQRVMPDLIMLDVEMPDINGYEAAQMLKDSDDSKGIPIIFLSAKSDPTSEMEGLNLGALDYIHKPFVSTLLLRRIETHLSLIEYRNELEERNSSIEKLLELKVKEVMQRKAAEAAAYKASLAKDEFLSRLSHEIRTPLNAIIKELIIATETDKQEKIKNSLHKATDMSLELLGIINDMLEISKTKTVS